MAVNLSVFPDFQYLEAHHQASLNAFIKPDNFYSDYNFISLWSWDHQQKLKVCTLNGNLVIRFQDYQDADKYFYSFFGTRKISKTAEVLLNFSLKENQKELKLIPEFVAKKLKHKKKFIVQEDRDNHDYIVAIKTMVELEGNSNNNKRNNLRQFLRDNDGKLSLKELDVKSQVDRDKIREVVQEWGGQVASKDSYNENELRAIDKLLNNHHTITTSNIHIVGITINNELKAFSIAEILENNFAMWHYKKADRSIKGLGIALDHFTAKQLHSLGVQYLNHEQDLGVEGLRHAKMANNPVFFLKKYTVGLK